MTRSLTCRTSGALAVLLAAATFHMAATAVAQITESDWDASLTGAQEWQVDANWSTPAFPNDPGRVDMDEATIEPVIGANVSVGLGADLNLNVGATDVTVASLRLGGTAGAVTTDVSSTGGRLVFENYELNDATDPENIIPSYNASRALIVSGGAQGSTNVISAPVFINDETLDVGSVGAFETTNDLTFSGPITFAGPGASSLNAVTTNAEVLITGEVVVDDVNPSPGPDAANPTDAGINMLGGAVGTVRVDGVISGAGQLRVNGGGGTVVLSGDNTISGSVTYGGGTTVLDNDLAFGTATVKAGGTGAVLVSTDDSRTIANEMDIPNYAVIGGEHSLTWTGGISQSNTRGIINLVAEGKTFTVAGEIGADADPPEPTQNHRELYFDGNGETIVSGAMKNRIDMEMDQPQSFGLRGTGTMRVTGTSNTYSAYTYVEGGNLHYATSDSLPPAAIRSIAGAVGVDSGTVYTGGDPGAVNTAFLSKLNNRAQAPLTLEGDLKTIYEFDNGGLMLTAAEADADLDFTAGTLVNAADMSLAGPAEGITYTGAVTPANSTYRFGGGTGVITLPGTNQLTGSNNFVATNGLDSGDVRGLGGVRITGVNDYTGMTRVDGNDLQSLTMNAGGEGIAREAYNGTTLSVTHLADGGADSSIGASTGDAENLVLQGGTLRYEGAGDSTDRLFTIGTRGATLDASGSGPLVFSNNGALAIDTAEDRSGITSGIAFTFETGVTQSSEFVAFDIADTSDLVPGMQISGEFLEESADDDDDVITIVKIQSPTRVEISDRINLFTNTAQEPSTLSFVDAPRTFALAGDNTGENVLNPSISDSATGVVNLEKSGAGKWVLNGANTYTGDTSVEEGVLSITNAYLADDSEVTVLDDAVFDLDFSGADEIGSLLLGGVEQLSIGTYGGVGSGADFESSYFSGTGWLQVASVAVSGLAGDFNNDGVVDASDYAMWRDNLGAPEGALVNVGDLTGAVGDEHYSLWRSNYGATSEGAASVGVATPEPAAVVLLLAAGVLPFAGRRRG